MKSLFAFFMLLATASHAQIFEDFSNYETSDLPKYWLGDTQNFQINSENELQLNAPAAGQSMLVHRNPLPDSFFFEIRFRLDFAPSLQNQLRIYLQADTSNLLISNGYFIEIGESGGGDAVQFFKQQNGQTKLIARGANGAVATEPVDATLKIYHRKNGEWTCSLLGTNAPLLPQFSVVDTSFSGKNGKHFGIFCKYTDTRREAFYFEKIVAGDFQLDSKPPEILSIEATADTVLILSFSEPLDSSVLKTGNFFETTSPAAPVFLKASFYGFSGAEIRLLLPFKMLKNELYQLAINELEDLEGNVASNVFKYFDFKGIAVPRELYLQINEIMADPSPPVGLPEVEWLEIWNASDEFMQLEGVTLSDETGTTAKFPKFLLPPKRLMVVLPAGFPDFLPLDTFVLRLPNFPSLNNDHDLLILKNADGEIIDVIKYQSDWHTSASKKNGGYSMEKIRNLDPCLVVGNWGSTQNLAGGTPLLTNSIANSNFFYNQLRLLLAFPRSESDIFLKFSEGLNSAAARNPLNYRIIPPRNIEEIEFSELNRTEVILHLAEPLDSNRIYDLRIENTLTDCVGNPIFYPDDADIAIPKVPENQDIVINEILFDPASGGSRFVEIINRSNKILDFENLFVADFSGSGGAVKIGRQRLFSPDEIIVLADDTADIAQKFRNVRPEKLIKIKLPTFAADEGNCSFFWSKNGKIVLLDSFNFSKTMQNALLLPDVEGVSLERIRADLPTNSMSNWTSAASQDPFDRGTPTRPNSQSRSNPIFQQEEFISLVSNRLSPDGDGRDDFLEIRFDLPQSGFAATFSIFDSDGRLVKRLVRQDLLGTSGTVRWDGDFEESGERVRPGIHVLMAEIFHPDGSVWRQKLVFSVVF